MNREQIIRFCGELGRSGDSGQRALSDWPTFINMAQREIAERSLWSFMHDQVPTILSSGQTSVSLGATFKQLGQEESPVSFDYGNYKLPVKVMSRERIEGMGIWPWLNGPFSLSIPGGYMPAMVVFLENNVGGDWTLNVPPQYVVTQAITFNVSAYYYPDDLMLGSDHNAFTDDGNLCQAIINISKSIAYQIEESDGEKANAARLMAEASIERALYSDSARKFNGRTARM